MSLAALPLDQSDRWQQKRESAREGPTMVGARCRDSGGGRTEPMRQRGVSLAARLHVGVGRGGKAKGGVVGIEREGDTCRNETGIGTNLGSEWWGSGRVRRCYYGHLRLG